jgi:Protein of unknown function (DUF3093)
MPGHLHLGGRRHLGGRVDQRRRAGPDPLRVRYHERLSAPWWAYLGLPLAAVAVLVELGIGYAPLASPGALLAAVVVGLLVPLAAARIVVTVEAPSSADGAGTGFLRVDDARLPAWAIGSVTVVSHEARRQLLGIDARPLAFVVQRAWLPGGVRVDLADPDDPTPYWYVSSRRPEELAAALRDLCARGAPDLDEPASDQPAVQD